jgi:hypothetical protein
MRKLAFYVTILLCLTLIFPVSGGCSETDDENTFIKLLSLLPATAKEERVITLIDFERLWEVNGISIFDEDGQRISRDDYVTKIIDICAEGSPVGLDILDFSSYWTSKPFDLDTSSLTEENVGYEVTDIDAEINNIHYLSVPGLFDYDVFTCALDVMIAAVGELSAKVTNDALGNRDEWPSWATENYTSEDHRGIIIHSWGDCFEEHLQDRKSPPNLDHLGRAIPMAVSDGLLFIGSYPDHLKSMIDTTFNEVDSLADIPEYKMVAQGMNNLGAIGVVIIEEAQTKYIQMLCFISRPRIDNYITVGFGPGMDETGSYIALVAVYENGEDAELGISQMEQKIEAFNTFYDAHEISIENAIYNTEIRRDGRVMMAKLYTANKDLWIYWFFNQWEEAYLRELDEKSGV